ncbi:MAG: hypothetical protein WCP89_00730 [archaeon]
MNSKKAVIGDFTVTFVATVAIILILFIFAFVSGVVKMFGVSEGIKIEKGYSQNAMSLQSLDYGINFTKLTDERFFIANGKTFKQAEIEANIAMDKWVRGEK